MWVGRNREESRGMHTRAFSESGDRKYIFLFALFFIFKKIYSFLDEAQFGCFMKYFCFIIKFKSKSVFYILLVYMKSF